HGLGLTSDAKTVTPIETKTAVVKETSPKVPQGEQTLCTVQAVKVDMPAMLRMLSDQSRIGLVLLSPIETKLTVNLVKIPFIDALQHVCTLSGLTFLKVRSTYVV